MHSLANIGGEGGGVRPHAICKGGHQDAGRFLDAPTLRHVGSCCQIKEAGLDGPR